MRLTSALLSLAAASVFGACSSSVADAIDGTLQARINTVKDCFPPMFDKAGSAFDLTSAWRFGQGTFPDPFELTWSQAAGGGPVTATYVDFDCTVDMTITFHGPTGAAESIDVSAAASLSEAMATAATELRNRFGAQLKFILGVWEITSVGDVFTGSGAFTGVIGGAANQNELESLWVTTNDTSGGMPPNGQGTVSGTDGVNTCTLTFGSPNGIMTDTLPNQDYPIGTVTFTLVGEETANGSVVFDGTQFATMSVSDVPGSFSYDLDFGEVTYNAP